MDRKLIAERVVFMVFVMPWALPFWGLVELCYCISESETWRTLRLYYSPRRENAYRIAFWVFAISFWVYIIALGSWSDPGLASPAAHCDVSALKSGEPCVNSYAPYADGSLYHCTKRDNHYCP